MGTAATQIVTQMSDEPAMYTQRESAAQAEDYSAQMHDDVPQQPKRPTLTRTSSYTFKRAFFRAYIAKHKQDPSHLGTVLEGSCHFVQDTSSLTVSSSRLPQVRRLPQVTEDMVCS
jgi:hypothetical protein